MMSCDSGNITDKDITVVNTGKVVKLTATISGMSDWNGSCNVALAAFQDGSKYAVTQRAIPESTPDGEKIAMTLENLPADISTIELALTNKLRGRILTLASMNMSDFDDGGDTIRMDLGELILTQEGCIRQGVFNIACIQCHGANGHAAAGLDLTANMPKPDRLRLILIDGGASILHYNHSDVLSSHFKNNLEEVKTLLYEWINGKE